MIFNVRDNAGKADMGQRGAEYPAWVAICAAAGVKTYVEVGCGIGRGLMRLRAAGVSKVVGIDLCPHPPSVFTEERPGDTDLGYIFGDSSSAEVVQKALDFLRGEPDGVFIDADHSYGKSRKDYEVWWPHARILLGFHDVLMDHADSVGTLWNQLKLDTRSLELYSRDRKSVLEWMDQGALDASPDGRLAAGGIGILFKE
jgi:methyltransferase family protein